MNKRKKSGLDSLARLAGLALLTEKSLRDYGKRVRGLVMGYWRGAITRRVFISSMRSAVDRGITQAFREGAREVGIKPEEFTVAEHKALLAAIDATIEPIEDFADQISEGSRANKGKLRRHLNRAKMWTNRYNATRSMASALVGADKKLKWVWDPAKEHCADCAKLQGRVYRASAWAKAGIAPQNRDLECGGWLCGCEFIVTDEPITRGRIPRISGQ